MTDALQDAAQARSELRQTEAAFTAMREAAIREWLASPDADSAFREQLYRAVKVIDTVQGQLHQVIATGDMAQFAAELRRDANPPV